MLKENYVIVFCDYGHVKTISAGTVLIAKILSVKNERAWVSIVSYLKR